MMHDRYEIRTVEDFFKVPAEKLEPFLADFVQFLAIGHMFPDHRVLKLDKSKFTWIDDGKTGLSSVTVEAAQND